VQNLLHVEGEQEELGEDRPAHQQAGDVRSRERPQPEDPHRQERRPRAKLDHDEGGDESRRSSQETDRLGGSPAVLRRARHRVDEQHQAAGDRGCTGDVEATVPEVGSALT